MADIDIDLDALAPKSGTMTYKGNTITIPPPLTRDLFEGASLIDKLNAADTIPEIEKAYKALEVFFKRIIPELDEALSIYQYKKLYEKMQELSVPPDSKALAEAGITVASDGDEKKDEPDTQEK